MAYFEENLRAVLASLEECHASLIMNGDRDTAQLVSVAILELRIKLNQINDSELKALCDEMLADDDESSQEPQSRQGPRRPPLLKLVK